MTLTRQSPDYYKNLSEEKREKKNENIKGIDIKTCLIRKSQKGKNIWKVISEQEKIIC